MSQAWEELRALLVEVGGPNLATVPDLVKNGPHYTYENGVDVRIPISLLKRLLAETKE